MGDARVFFTNSGSESVDIAMKLARLHHVLRGDEQRVTIVARSGGYHGTAYGGTSAQGTALDRSGFGPLMDDVVHVGRHELEETAGVFAQHGALLILDEVITGFGRLGSWFASTHFGVEPDLVTFGRGEGGTAFPRDGAGWAHRTVDAGDVSAAGHDRPRGRRRAGRTGSGARTVTGPRVN